MKQWIHFHEKLQKAMRQRLHAYCAFRWPWAMKLCKIVHLALTAWPIKCRLIVFTVFAMFIPESEWTQPIWLWSRHGTAPNRMTEANVLFTFLAFNSWTTFSIFRETIQRKSNVSPNLFVSNWKVCTAWEIQLWQQTNHVLYAIDINCDNVLDVCFGDAILIFSVNYIYNVKA